MLRSSRLYGRDGDLVTLARLVSAAASGQGGGVAVVSGEAGLGKSALVRAVASEGDSVTGRAAAAGPSLGPVVELVVGLIDRGASIGSPAMGEYGPAITALVPELSGDRGPWRGEAPQPVVLAEAVLRLWSTLAVPRRPALVVEDVHWAEEATFAVLRRLCHRVSAAGAALLLTSRPEGSPWPELQRLVDARNAVGIALAPLSASAVTALVADCLQIAVAALPEGLATAAAAAGGWPLLVEELLSDLNRTGALTRGADGWLLVQGRVGVPPRLEAATRERMQGLTPSHARAVERAAVLGVRPDLGLLVASFETDLDTMAAAVRAAVDVGIFEVDSTTGRPRFRHDLLREAVLGGVLEPHRIEHATRLFEAVTGRSTSDAPAGLTSRSPGFATVEDPLAQLDEDSLALAARLSVDAGLRRAAGPLQLALARRLLDRGLPLAAANAADAATKHPQVRVEALACQVEALALAGEVDRALAAADRLEALPGGQILPQVREAVARAIAQRGDWQQAERLLEPLSGPAERSSTSALAALIALERGDQARAGRQARRALRVSDHGPAACQALEVLGRIARGKDLDEAQAWFRRCVVVAEADGLVLWRARGLHETATIAQLRTLDVEPLRVARTAAVEAGAPGLVSAVDFHLAAVLGVRFNGAEALAVARRLLADTRTQGADRLQAWAWILIGQAHAVAGHREHADLAAAEALALAGGDPEIEGVAVGICRGLPALLAEDIAVALQHWQAGITQLRRCATFSPLPPWYLWPVLATVADLEGDGGLRARRESAAPDLRITPGADGLWHLARAVAAGREGHLAEANAAAVAAADRLATVPAFAGWRHLAHRWVANDAIGAGWGEPAQWMTEAADWFSGAGFDAVAGTCRGLARQAGAPQRRRGRGGAAVPAHLHRLGVTSREVDVLRLLAQGLTNAEIAGRLYLSPRTVKGYVEQLLAKTGTANRTQLAARLER